MSEVTIIGVDLAKRVFHLHGARVDGTVAYRKKLSRLQFLAFLSQQPCCTVAMEACATAHGWGREITKLGHSVSLIPPSYVKPFVKRQKNDTADAEAIAEAASRPTMRFVAVKPEDQQARAILFRTRQMFVRQRTQMINALRGHLAEHGVVAPQGPANIRNLAAALEDQSVSLPETVRHLGRVYVDQITSVETLIADLNRQMRVEARETQTTRRLQTMPGVGPVTAVAIETFAPPMETFRRGAGLRCLAGARPAPTFQRRKAAAGEDFKDGAARHPQIADRRRNGNDPGNSASQSHREFLAHTHVGTQAEDLGCHRACQQDGSRPLGHDNKRRGLPGSGGSGSMSAEGASACSGRRECDEVTEQ